jgi:hypothetical protein
MEDGDIEPGRLLALTDMKGQDLLCP